MCIKVLLPLPFPTVKIVFFKILAECVVYLEVELCAKYKDVSEITLIGVYLVTI